MDSKSIQPGATSGLSAILNDLLTEKVWSYNTGTALKKDFNTLL